MAEEPQKPAEEVVAAVAQPETEAQPDKPVPETDKETHADKAEAAVPEAEKKEGDAVVVTEKAVEGEAAESEAEKPVEGKNQIAQSVSFKEESYVVGDLPEAQKKALDDLKNLIQEALNKHELSSPPPPPPPKEEDKKKEEAVAAAEEKKEEAEEKKEEAAAAEEEKKEEVVAAEEKKEEVVAAAEEEKKEEAAAAEEEKKEEVVAAEEKKEEVVAAAEEEKKETVEAIEESVVSVKVEEEGPSSSAVAVEEEKKEEAAAPPPPQAPEEVSIWGIPLLADERSDVILLKFLRARDFKVKDAFTMIKNTVRWRKEFGIDSLIEEDLGSDWDKVVFTQGVDKEGHPVCYNVFGEFENKELYQKTFSDEEKRQKFIRWRIQLLEKSVRKLDFSPRGISTIVQVNDLKNSPGQLSKRELRQATNQALQLLQDNYPEFVAKQVFINVPWWYLAFSRMISAFLTQRTKSKFVFAGPSKSAETLFKYIAPEQVPVQYGGLSREGEQEFSTADPVTEVTIKPATKHTVEFSFAEKSHLVWELRVVGWDVSHGAEFAPSADDGYTVIVQKSRKIAPADETVICNSFKVGEPGKVVLTIDNQTSKKKKLLYRSKTTPISE
ncbi:patellin-3 isoform X1 [Arachis duranensis]|uniref:Patellin-3 isoform X1 n=1 Tax=Arachis duranensis TaxID=130453 RepID=A0A9C6TIV7_ARADU|nr:patellin-3 isoform X1 [Arachis duranensis]